MISIESTPKEQQERDNLNKRLLKMNDEIYIRKSFDKACISKEAESWIRIAKELGFKKLAAEMQSDLEFDELFS